MALSDDAGRDLSDRARQLETLERLSQRFGASLSGALAAGTSGGRQLGSVLDDVASTLSGALGRGLTSSLQATLTGGLASATRALAEAAGSLVLGGGLRPFAQGGIVPGGVVPFASGGVVASPTYFPLRSGTGLMGEAGPEAIVPLARGPDGRLGIRGGGGGATNVSVTIQANDLDSFRRSEAQVSAALARAVARGRRAS